MKFKIIGIDDLPAETSMLDSQPTFAANPQIPIIVSKCFNWQPIVIEISHSDYPNPSYLILNKIGRKLVSVPHFSHASCPNLIGGQTFVQELYENLNKTFPGINQIEIRYKVPLSRIYDTNKVITELKLYGDYEKTWSGFRSSVRRKVRKSAKNGIIIQRGTFKYLDVFYNQLLKNSCYLGSPVLKKSFFKALLHISMPLESCIFIAILESKIIGAAFMIHGYGYAENLWFATNRNFNKLYTSYALLRAMIEYALEAGCHTFSFGRSTHGSGVHMFKKQWGGIDRVMYRSFLKAERDVRDYHWFPEIWKQVPLPVANVIGPHLAKFVY